MTGKLSTITNLHLIESFRFYRNDNDYLDIPNKQIKFENLTDYDRRYLMYSYLPREYQEPMFIKYTSNFTVLKLYIPKGITKIVPISNNEELLENYEGVFYDLSSPNSMFEYNNNKWLTLMENSADLDLTNYFVLLHEDNKFDGHREDFELIVSNIQAQSLVNKYLLQDYLRTSSADLLGNMFFSSDASLFSLGQNINDLNFDGYTDMPKVETGKKVLGFLISKDFSCNYFGSIIGSGDRVLIGDNIEDLYGRWVADTSNLPDKPFIWNKTIFKKED